MSLQIGQIRKNNSTSYLTDLSNNITDVSIISQGFGEQIFTNYGIQLNGGFQIGTPYYLRFAVKRRAADTDSGVAGESQARLQFSLYLYTDLSNHELGTFQKIADNIIVDPIIIESDTEQYRYFEFIFTPNKTYSYLAFVLTRITYDYTEGGRSVSAEDIFIKGDSGDLAIINNILPNSHNIVDQIGIQTRPGTLLCINGEDIRVGRSGTYEINNGLKINFVGIVSPNGNDSSNINNFILDYAYNE